MAVSGVGPNHPQLCMKELLHDPVSSMTEALFWYQRPRSRSLWRAHIMPLLRAHPTRFFSWDYQVWDEADLSSRLELELGAFREGGRVLVDGEEFIVRKEGVLGSHFILEAGTGVLAEAVKQGAFSGTFKVRVADRVFTLRAAGLFSRRYILLHGRQELGSISPSGFFGRTAVVDLPADIPIPIRLFLLCLVLLLWKRAAAAAASS